jgi:hypothetical protein
MKLRIRHLAGGARKLEKVEAREVGSARNPLAVWRRRSHAQSILLHAIHYSGRNRNLLFHCSLFEMAPNRVRPHGTIAADLHT